MTLIGAVAGSSVVGSCLGAWLTMRFTYRRFRQERWWEKKSETYQKLVGCLTDVYFGLEEDIAFIEHPPDEPLGPEERLREQEAIRHFREAKGTVRRVLIEGAAILSPGARGILTDFFKEFERPVQDEDPYTEMLRQAAAAKGAAIRLQGEMKGELGVR